MEKKRKKSLVGFTDEEIWDRLKFKMGNISCLYLSEKRGFTEKSYNINPLKVRITIEEL